MLNRMHLLFGRLPKYHSSQERVSAVSAVVVVIDCGALCAASIWARDCIAAKPWSGNAAKAAAIETVSARRADDVELSTSFP